MPDEYDVDVDEVGDDDGVEEVGHDGKEVENECVQWKENHYDDDDCGDDSDEDCVDNEEGLDQDVDVDEMLARLGKWESGGYDGQQCNCQEKPEKLDCQLREEIVTKLYPNTGLATPF